MGRKYLAACTMTLMALISNEILASEMEKLSRDPSAKEKFLHKTEILTDKYKILSDYPICHGVPPYYDDAWVQITLLLDKERLNATELQEFLKENGVTIVKAGANTGIVSAVAKLSLSSDTNLDTQATINTAIESLLVTLSSNEMIEYVAAESSKELEMPYALDNGANNQ